MHPLLFLVLALVPPTATVHPASPLSAVRPEAVTIARSSAVALSVSPTIVPVGRPLDATVTWSGVPDPAPGDWLGVYHANDSVAATAPIKYQFANASAGASRGRLMFRLLNLRADYVVHFFRGGVAAPVLVATSNPVAVANPREPMAGRLALTRDPSEMLVTWTQVGVVHPAVVWGTAPGQLLHTAPATTFTYRREQLCGGVAAGKGWRDPGVFHSATLRGLAPGQPVWYKFGDVFGGWSPEYRFAAAPAPGAAVRLFAFGDLGQHQPDDSLQEGETPASRKTTDGMWREAQDKQLVLHVGDISYACGHEASWEHYHDQIQPLATRLPWMLLQGNHERDAPNSGSALAGPDSGGECGVATAVRFPMPSASAALQPHDQPWYGLDFGAVHFLMASTEHAFAPGSPQYAFLEQDLAAVNRSRTPWVVFAGHRPFYVDSTEADPPDGDQPVAADLRASLEELLFAHKVDVVLGAHHHSYQRSCPVYQGRCRPGTGGRYGAPVVVNVGMAGAENSRNVAAARPAIWEAVDVYTHGYTVIAANATHFRMEYRPQEYEGNETHVHDEFVLVRPGAGV